MGRPILPTPLGPTQTSLTSSPVATIASQSNQRASTISLGRTESCHRDNYIWFGINKFPRQNPEPFWILSRKAMVQMNVLAFNIAEIVEGFH
jgi:hypothetical protein